jgi:hypothetical protein
VRRPHRGAYAGRVTGANTDRVNHRGTARRVWGTGRMVMHWEYLLFTARKWS